MADPTTIAAGTTVSGRITGEEDLAVAGLVDGEIELSETLTVADGGLVRGTVHARQVLIDGAVEGDVRADERVVLSATARVTGSLEAPVLRLDDGARFAGEVVMDVETTGGAPAGRTAPARRTETARAETARTETAPARASAPARAARPTGTAGAAAAPAATTTTTVVEEVAEEAGEEPEPAEAFPYEEDFSELPRDEIEDYTVKELREHLRERDLPVSGTKDELIARLRDSDND